MSPSAGCRTVNTAVCRLCYSEPVYAHCVIVINVVIIVSGHRTSETLGRWMNAGGEGLVFIITPENV